MDNNQNNNKPNNNFKHKKFHKRFKHNNNQNNNQENKPNQELVKEAKEEKRIVTNEEKIQQVKEELEELKPIVEIEDKPQNGKRIINRRALIIYYKQENALSVLDDYIHIVYNSKKYKYVLVYLDEKMVYETKKKLINAKGIKDVIDSKFDLETIELNA